MAKNMNMNATVCIPIIIILLVLVLFMQINNKQEQFQTVEYSGHRRVNGKRVWKRARFVTHSWANASRDTGVLHNTMKRFDVNIHPTNDYYNYCQLKKALGN
jgi:hypothetical protein